MYFVQIGSLGFVVMATFGVVASVAQGLESISPTGAKDSLQLFQAAGVNNPPQLDPLPDRTVDEESALEFVVTASDPDAPPQNLTFRLGAGALTGAMLNPTNGLFAWTPTEGQGPGTTFFSVIVTDDGSPSLSITQRFTVFVLEANRPPSIPTIPDQTVNESEFVVASVLADDPDLPLQSLTFSLAEAPAGASLSTSGLFLWTPDEGQGPTTNRVVVIATDDGSPSLSATQQFTVIVREVNYPPVLPDIPEQSINEGELLAFTVPATDPDLPGERLTFSLGADAPDGSSINPTNGLFAWTPAETHGPGSYFVAVLVTDDGSPAQSDAKGFIVVVGEVNRPPELPVLPDQTVNEAESVAFSVLGTDVDVPVQVLTYSLGPGAPEGASLSEGGFFFWTPGEQQGPGTNEITILVRDSATPSLSATQRFTVIVREVNHAPELGTLADHTVNEGELVSFNARASDTDLPQQSLEFTLGAGAPDGASIDPQTGAFAWTPTEAQGPGNYQIAVIVTDSGVPAGSASRSFAVVVREVNQPPMLPALADRSASVGALLVFSVPAGDADVPAQTLLYSLGSGAPAGAPAGAGITVDGLFTWTPSQAQASTTNLIRVVVSDGSLTATQSVTVVVFSGTLTPPRLVNPRFTVNSFSASVDSLAGRRYFLERTAFFTPSDWRTVGEFQGTGGTMLLTDPAATNRHSAYRARVQ
jgi:hypothetical protein